ncbi:hypothetical protein [Tepidibacter aestuarii]|uniref:hypothetical protein n=1 Tax=Tepidibacter aestuarii TaxID=2925782 RepID=UPI0020BF7884|nr:hypothetical protein [Tepidibacter aestuarii]CAH2213185.1 protein of unknown function [Tepidibacter aestuarii]
MKNKFIINTNQQNSNYFNLIEHLEEIGEELNIDIYHMDDYNKGGNKRDKNESNLYWRCNV